MPYYRISSNKRLKHHNGLGKYEADIHTTPLLSRCASIMAPYLCVPSLVALKKTCWNLRHTCEIELSRINAVLTTAEDLIFGPTRDGWKQNVTASIPHLRYLCERKVPIAMCMMGKFLISPLTGVERDELRGQALIQEAASFGYPLAQVICLARGYGCEIDMMEAKKRLPWLGLADGFTHPLYLLEQSFVVLCMRSPTRPDVRNRVESMADAAALGWIEAFPAFALEKDYASLAIYECFGLTAAKLLQRGADQGHAESQYVYGMFLEQGLRGVIRNLSEALHWYGCAAAQGHVKALHSIGRHVKRGWSLSRGGGKSRRVCHHPVLSQGRAFRVCPVCSDSRPLLG